MACLDGTPGVISDADFLQQQALLGSGFAHLVRVESSVYSGLHLIVLMTDPTVEAGLLQPYANNLNTVSTTRTAYLLREATTALEDYIQSTCQQTFNDYLLTHGLKVSQDFATLSGKLGRPIDPGNVA